MIIRLDRFSGVNLESSPRELNYRELRATKNMHAVKPGGDLTLRLNSATLSSDSGVLGNGSIVAIYPYFDGGSIQLVGWVQGNDAIPARLVQFIENQGWLAFDITQPNNGGSILEKASSSKPAFVQWQDKLYVFTGGSTPGWRIDPKPGIDNIFDHTTCHVIPISSLWAAGDMPRARVAGVYRGTVVIAGFQDDPSLVRWLEVGDPTVLVSAAKGIWVNRHIGDMMTAIFEVMIQGGSGALNSYAVVAKSKSMRMLTGDPPTTATDGTIDASVVISDIEGCISKETVVKTQYGAIWCSGANVWLASTNGSFPITIGNPIKSMLEQRSPNPDLWCAAYYNGFYRLSIPSKGSDQLADGLTQTEQWWCDLRAFPKISWWGPMEIPSDSMAVMQQPNGSAKLMSALARYDDPMFYLEELEVATPERVDHYNAEGIVPTQPSGEAQFKEFDLDDPGTDKIVEGVEVTYHNTNPATIRVDLIKNSGTGVSSQSEYGLYHDGFKLDLDEMDEGDENTKPLADFTFRTRAFNPPQGTRFLAQSFQPVVKLIQAEEGGDIRLRSVALRIRSNKRRPSYRDPNTDYGDGTLGGGVDPV